MAELFCGTCGHRMPADPEWMSGIIDRGEAREVGPGRWRFPCPRCGKTTLREVTRYPDGTLAETGDHGG